MHQTTKLSIAIALLFLVASCGQSKKEGNATINDKKAKLEKLKAQKSKDEAEIQKLQDELALIDTSSASSIKEKLVSIMPVAIQDFNHYVDLQGKVDAENISYISPSGMGGQVRALYVKQGQFVKKGQLLLKLDDAIMKQQVNAATQQLAGIRTQLALAKDLAGRQQNLWNQGIGTEVQLITAKTNVQSLQDQLATATESVKVAQAQLNTSNIYSDVSGIADIVNIRVGETFTGMTAAGPQIKIVNTSSLKVVTSVPENYTSRLHKGSPAQITVTDVNTVINAPVSLLSQSVDPANRGFVAEIKVPYNPLLKPNQAAKVRILDYSSAKTIVIPINTVQTDENGKYVYVLVKSSNGRSVAKKKSINLGEVYGNNAEVKTGLQAGDELITEGYQNIYDGQNITTEIK
ncbi:MAG: efflux RND transporter periplasmic adaptor subunit [Bacteroidetes bacterium]|nr:efflux RND transporter periplasmic adaptor subunit [Bacteroidota bacterium]